MELYRQRGEQGHGLFREEAKIILNMAAKICKAVLNLDPTDHGGINTQGKRFMDFMYKELVVYADPPITEADFIILYNASVQAAAKAVDGSKQDRVNRDSASGALYDAMEVKLITYINGLYTGDATSIGKSGAKISLEPTPVPPPDQPIIKKIAKGNDPGTIKVNLVRGINSANKRRSKIHYRLKMMELESDMVGVEVCSSFDSRKIIGTNIPASANRFYAVIAENSGGKSPLSDKVKYYLVP